MRVSSEARVLLVVKKSLEIVPGVRLPAVAPTLVLPTELGPAETADEVPKTQRRCGDGVNSTGRFGSGPEIREEEACPPGRMA